MKKPVCVYEAIAQNAFDLVQPVDDDDWKTLQNLLNGEPRKAGWTAPQMKVVRSYKGRKYKSADCPWYTGSGLALRERAMHAVKDLVESCGELLPFSVEGEPFYFVNARIISGALDMEKSDISRFTSGRIMSINKPVFYAQKLEGLALFRLSEISVSVLYLGESFVRRWNEAGLTGIRFEKLFDSDEAPPGSHG